MQGFGRVSLEPGASATVDFLLELGAARGTRRAGGIRWSSASADAEGKLRVHPGLYTITVTDAEPRFFEASGASVVVQEAL